MTQPPVDAVRLARMQSRNRPRLSRRAGAALAVAVGALISAGCGSVGYQDDAAGNVSNGRALFIENCGSCHVLADAETTGTVGPDLDAAFAQFRADSEGDDPSDEDRARAEDTIRQVVRGQIAYPVVDPPTESPGMPADIVTGQDAADVAAYVARVAGTGDSANP